MLDFTVIASCIIASSLMVVGLGLGILNFRKYRIGSRLGMAYAKSFEKYVPSLITCIPATLIFLGCWYAKLGTFSGGEFLVMSVIFIIDVVVLMFTIALSAELPTFIGYIKELLNTNNLTTYFFENNGNDDVKNLNIKRFKDTFGFNPYENQSKKMSFEFMFGSNKQIISDIARTYHEVSALQSFLSSLPASYRMESSDKELSSKLEQQIKELELMLKEASPVLQGFLTENVNAIFTATERKSLDKLRKMSLTQQKKPSNFVHPAIESLLQIQADKNVSFTKKVEAKELEREVRILLEKEQKNAEWTPDEIAESSLTAVKMFFNMNH